VNTETRAGNRTENTNKRFSPDVSVAQADRLGRAELFHSSGRRSLIFVWTGPESRTPGELACGDTGSAAAVRLPRPRVNDVPTARRGRRSASDESAIAIKSAVRSVV